MQLHFAIQNVDKRENKNLCIYFERKNSVFP